MKIIIFLTLIIIGAASLAESSNNPFFASLPVELKKGQTLPLADKISFDIQSGISDTELTKLTNANAISAARISEDVVTFELKGAATLAGLPAANHSVSSFVMDLEEESTRQFISGFPSANKQNISLGELTLYVSQYIEKPTYIHGFNIASKVATDRSGDCTEYAVLTTSLARALNFPARLIFGVVILEGESQVEAFRHAWTEVWLDNKWHLVDAALLNVKAPKMHYLPIAELDNEGPGYTLSLFAMMQQLPSKISGLRSLR